MSFNEDAVRLGDCITFVIDNRGKTPPLCNAGHELIETTSIVGTNKFPDFVKVSTSERVKFLKLFDMNGKLIRTESELVISLYDLKCGTYLLRLEFENSSSNICSPYFSLRLSAYL